MLLFFLSCHCARYAGDRLTNTPDPEGISLPEEGEKMPTDKLVDVSPLALRMSSPFNAGYWLSVA